MEHRLIVDTPNCISYDLQDVMDAVILGDALAVLPKLPSESVDLVFLDPPYNLQLPSKYLTRWKNRTRAEGVNESWDKFGSFEEYDQFIRSILVEVKRIMKPQATVWCIGTYHNIFRIGALMQDLGFWILNDVIWVKSNPKPNWMNVRFTNATETLIWAVKDKSVKKYTFHHKIARQYSKGNLAKNVWELPICIGNERLKDEKGVKVHPTQKPLALLRRVISVSTNENDVILDPLAGTGTTGVAAKEINRHFILIEKEEKYAKVCIERLNQLLG